MAHFQSISSEQWVCCKRSCCGRWLCFENFVAVGIFFFKYTNFVTSNDEQGIWVCKEAKLTVLQLPVFKGLWSPHPHPPHHCFTTASFQRIMIPTHHTYPITVLQLPVFKGLWFPPTHTYPITVLQLPVFKGLWSPPTHTHPITVLQLPVFKGLWSPPTHTHPITVLQLPPPPPPQLLISLPVFKGLSYTPPAHYSCCCETIASFQKMIPPPPPFHWSITASFKRITPPTLYFNVLQLPVLKGMPPHPPNYTSHCSTTGSF